MTLSASGALIAAGLTGCQALIATVQEDADSGLEVGTGDTGVDASGLPDGGPRHPDSGRHDASHDGHVADSGPHDAKYDHAVPTGDACGQNLEDCTNGIDDNCDGLIDCDDPECSGSGGQFSCSPLPTETGWTLVAYDSAGRPACPANFESAANNVVVSATGAADSCNCNCSNTQPATCAGAWAWTTNGATPSCGTAPGAGGNDIANGACVNAAGDNLSPTYYFVGASNGVHTAAGSCSGSSSVANTPAVDSVLGETCALAQAGGGCSTGGVCAPKVPASFQRCAISTTNAGCPTGLLQTSVATSISDTRGCGACACGTVDLACKVTGMEFWSSAGCSGGIYDMSTGCQDVAGSSLGDVGGTSNAYRADLSTNGQQTACTVTSEPAAQGGVMTLGDIIVCCEP